MCSSDLAATIVAKRANILDQETWDQAADGIDAAVSPSQSMAKADVNA